MYDPTFQEKEECIKMIMSITGKTERQICEQYANEVLATAYAIGGSYEIGELRQIALAMFINPK